MRNLKLLTIATIFLLSLGFVGCEVGEYEEFEQSHPEANLDQLEGLFVHQDDLTEIGPSLYVNCGPKTHAECGGQQCSRTGTCQWKNNSCQCIDVAAFTPDGESDYQQADASVEQFASHDESYLLQAARVDPHCGVTRWQSCSSQCGTTDTCNFCCNFHFQDDWNNPNYATCRGLCGPVNNVE